MDNETISATFINSTMISCLTPTVEMAGLSSDLTESVFISLNGMNWFHDPNNVNFTWHAPIHVTRVSPPFGSVSGGTVVTITGTGFADDTFCRFGATNITQATFVSGFVVSSPLFFAHSPSIRSRSNAFGFFPFTQPRKSSVRHYLDRFRPLNPLNSLAQIP